MRARSASSGSSVPYFRFVSSVAGDVGAQPEVGRVSARRVSSEPPWPIPGDGGPRFSSLFPAAVRSSRAVGLAALFLEEGSQRRLAREGGAWGVRNKHEGRGKEGPFFTSTPKQTLARVPMQVVPRVDISSPQRAASLSPSRSTRK